MSIPLMSNPAARGGEREIVAFRLAGQEFALDIMNVREIRGWTQVTPLPEAPAYIKGVINLRGVVLPIMDLAQRLGFAAGEPTSKHAIIVVQKDDQIIGLHVESLSEIMRIDHKLIQMIPDLGNNGTHRSLDGLLAFEGRMIGLISLDYILSDAGPVTAKAA